MSGLRIATPYILTAGSVVGMALPLAWANAGNRDTRVSVSATPTKELRPARAEGGAQEQSATAREVGTVFFRVVDQSAKQPLAGVTLKVFIDSKVVRQHVTDESGRLVIPLPREKFDRLTVTARKDGLAPKKVYLRRPTPGFETPRSYALAMGPGTSIGGIVRDAEGHPIEGVIVTPYEGNARDNVREALDLDNVTARADRDGRWHIDIIPADFDLGYLSFSFAHPEFLRPFDSSRFEASAAREELRGRRAVTVLHRGIPVSGRVVDHEGRPIAGASVRLGKDQWAPAEKTDADGRFRCKSAAATENDLTVQANGYAPEVRSVRASDGLAPLEFRLNPGRMIRGQIVDPTGKPLAGAFVTVSAWNRHTTLDWRTETDANGRFVWNSAPRTQ